MARTWSEVKAVLDDPSVPATAKSALISSWLRENPPPFLADQEPDDIKQKRQEADKYADAYNGNPLFAGLSVDDAYDKAKQSGDQAAYNEHQESKAVDEGKGKLDDTRPPAAEGGGTETSDEIFDAAAPALKLFETFGSLLAKIPDDCRGTTRPIDFAKDIQKPYDEQRGISFKNFVDDAAHFRTGSSTVDRTIQDTGARLSTLYQSWSGAGADAAADLYNEKIQPKATKLAQTLSNASEATLSTAQTVFQLCKGKADAIVGMYTDQVGRADYTLAQKVVAVANGEHGSKEDLAQIAGWMDLNFGTNLVKTLNDDGCCDDDEITRHGQDLAKQWVQNQFNPDMWDRLYQGFVKTCKDTKDLVEQAYDALDKVMGGIRNEFEGVTVPSGAPGGGGSGSGAGVSGGGPGGSGSAGSGGAGVGGGSGSGAGAPGGASGVQGGAGAGVGGGSGSGIAGGGSGTGVPGSGSDLPSGAGAGAPGGAAGGGSGSGVGVPPVPEGSAVSGGGPGAGLSGGGSDLPGGGGADGPGAGVPGGGAGVGGGPGIPGSGSGAGVSGGASGVPGGGAGTGIPPLPESSGVSGGSGAGVPPLPEGLGGAGGGPAGPGAGSGAGVPPIPEVPSGGAVPDLPASTFGPGAETPSAAGHGLNLPAGGGEPGSGSGGGSMPSIPEWPTPSGEAGPHSAPDAGPGDPPGADKPEVLKVTQGDKTFEMSEPDHDGTMDIKVGDGTGPAKDFKLDWPTEDEDPSGPQGTDDAYHPGPDGKIHIQDGDLKITAERPDGPDGPTTVTVDDGTGKPTTYTLGEDAKPALDDDLPRHHGTLDDLADAPSHNGDHSGVGDGGNGDRGGSDHADDVGGSHGADQGAGGHAEGSHGGDHAGTGHSGSGHGSSGHGVASSGLSGDLRSPELGEAPSLSGGHQTGTGAFQPQTVAAPAPAVASGAPAGQQFGGGMAPMGAMGGHGAAGGDGERGSRAYRIDGGVFEPVGEPGRRIIGSLDDFTGEGV